MDWGRKGKEGLRGRGLGVLVKGGGGGGGVCAGVCACGKSCMGM